jgi:uncharacterized protein (DUF433 family)
LPDLLEQLRFLSQPLTLVVGLLAPGERVSGAWVFTSTRIPVAALFENLEDGVSLTEFVALFPGVTEQQARSVLEHVAGSTGVALA